MLQFIKSNVPANETPREELLKRDVNIQFLELRRLREELAATKEELRRLKITNAALEKQNKKMRYENDYLHLSNVQQ